MKMKIADWLVSYLQEKGGEAALGDIIGEAGDLGFLGHQKDDGKWSNLGALYRARDAVPDRLAKPAVPIVEERRPNPLPGRYPITVWGLRDKGYIPE